MNDPVTELEYMRNLVTGKPLPFADKKVTLDAYQAAITSSFEAALAKNRLASMQATATPVDPSSLNPPNLCPALPAYAQTEALLRLLEGMDSTQAVRLHSVLVGLPYGFPCPAWLDWRKHITNVNPGWAFINEPTAAQKVTQVRWIEATPIFVSSALRDLGWNWEGVVGAFPWLTENDVRSVVPWAQDTGVWAGAAKAVAK